MKELYLYNGDLENENLNKKMKGLYLYNGDQENEHLNYGNN